MGVDGMAYNLMPCDREQGYLMPPSLQEWLPEEDLAWFILDVVEPMDLKELYAAYREDSWGAAGCDPPTSAAPGRRPPRGCRGTRATRQRRSPWYTRRRGVRAVWDDSAGPAGRRGRGGDGRCHH